MSIEALVPALEREAEERARALLAEAAERAREIRRRAGEEVELRRAARLEEHRRRFEAEAARREAEVRREIAEETLAARSAVLERIFEEAAARFRDTLGTDAYLRVLPTHLEEALRFVDPRRREAEVVVSDELEAKVRELLADGGREGSPGEGPVRVAVEDGAPPGVTVRTTDGHVVVDNTLPGRLHRRRPSLAMRLVDRIEEGA